MFFHQWQHSHVESADIITGRCWGRRRHAVKADIGEVKLNFSHWRYLSWKASQQDDKFSQTLKELKESVEIALCSAVMQLDGTQGWGLKKRGFQRLTLVHCQSRAGNRLEPHLSVNTAWVWSN